MRGLYAAAGLTRVVDAEIVIVYERCCLKTTGDIVRKAVLYEGRITSRAAGELRLNYQQLSRSKRTLYFVGEIIK
jgi:hypothetical protein